MNQLLARYALFYPVRYLRGEDVGRGLRDVRRFERQTVEQVQAEQRSRLRAAVERAAIDIPYYARLVARLGTEPSRWSSQEAFRTIPLLDKPTIQQHAAEMRSLRRCRTTVRSTSGSTGAPFSFEKDAQASAYMDAVMYHVYSWHGIEIGAPQARFWGMPVASRARTVARLKDILMNRIRCNAFATAEAELRAFHRRLIAFQPEYLYGYPSLINEFARFVVAHDLPLPPKPLKAAIGTGELPLPQHREDIERAFGTRFVNEYGCSEVGIIAFQCPAGRMHVMAHNVFVEVVNADGDVVTDEEGEIVVTELNARSMPFIRYRMNDRGKLLSEPCACGVPLPLIEVSAGRLRSQLILPSGRTVFDVVFSYTFKKGVAAFKAVQTGPEDIRIYIVPDQDFTEALMEQYVKILREKTFGEIRFQVDRVDAVPRERSGKLRYFVNELTSGTSWSEQRSAVEQSPRRRSD